MHADWFLRQKRSSMHMFTLWFEGLGVQFLVLTFSWNEILKLSPLARLMHTNCHARITVPVVISVTVYFVRVISTVISVIAETSGINARPPSTSMLPSLAAADNWWQGTVHKADIINGNISKYSVASLCLKNNLEWCCTAPHIYFALKPLFAWEKEREIIIETFQLLEWEKAYWTDLLLEHKAHSLAWLFVPYHYQCCSLSTPLLTVEQHVPDPLNGTEMVLSGLFWGTSVKQGFMSTQ